MFPIFLWVEEYKGFKDFQINLDNEYDCKIELGEDIVTLSTEENKKEEINIFKLKKIQHIKKKSIIIKNLEIRENKNYKKLSNFYGNNIDNLKIIVGKNGTGKSSILEFLALDNKKIYNYLLIFKSNKKINNEKMFYIEGNLPAIFSLEALHFIKNRNNFRVLTNIFTFYMNINNEGICLGQEDNRTRESLIGAIKYNLVKYDNWNNNSKETRIENFYTSYNIYSEYLYLFLNEIYHTKLYDNYKTIMIEVIFKENNEIKLNGSYSEREKEKIIEIFKQLDVTTNIPKKSKQERILKAFCNDIYKHILLTEFNKIYASSSETIDYQLYDIIINLDKEIKNKYLKSNLKDTLKELLNYTREYAPVNYYEQYLEFYNIIEENNFFQEDSHVYEITGIVKQNVQAFLKKLDSYHSPSKAPNEIYKFFGFKPITNAISDGENCFVAIFSTINFLIRKYGNEETEDAIIIGKKYITIMIDEPDLYLHPEWCRIFLSKLLEVLSNYKKIELYKDIIFNIIIVTHSPYLLSDVMNEDVIYITKEKEGNPLAKRKEDKTFGANIMELYKNSFFMESTFGEFAKVKIQGIIEELSDKTKKITEERKWEVWETIQMIGENLVRKKMENMYYEYFETKKEKSELETLIEEKGLSKVDIEKLIEQIKGI